MCAPVLKIWSGRPDGLPEYAFKSRYALGMSNVCHSASCLPGWLRPPIGLLQHVSAHSLADAGAVLTLTVSDVQLPKVSKGAFPSSDCACGFHWPSKHLATQLVANSGVSTGRLSPAAQAPCLLRLGPCLTSHIFTHICKQEQGGMLLRSIVIDIWPHDLTCAWPREAYRALTHSARRLLR